MSRAGQFVNQLRAVGGIGQVGRAHFDGDAVLLSQAVGQRVEQIFAASRDDQAVAARCQFGRERFANVL